MISTIRLLTEESIASCLSEFDDLPGMYFRDEGHRAKIRQRLETVVRNNERHFGEKAYFEYGYQFKEHFKRLEIFVKVRGEDFDPTVSDLLTEEKMEMHRLAVEGGALDWPLYKYEHGSNKVWLVLRRQTKLGSSAKMAIGALLGLLLSVAGLGMSDAMKTELLSLCNQVNDILIGLITMSATLVVFLMVINSITSCGSISRIKRLGGKVIKGYLFRYAVMSVVLVAYFFIMFDFSFVGAESDTGFVSSVVAIVTDVFPVNFVSPFEKGNFLQIIVIGAFIGAALLVVGESADPVLPVFRSLTDVASTIMEWCCGLLPVFVMLVVPTVFWSGNLSLISKGLIHMVLIVVLSFLQFFIFFFIMCKKRKIPLGKALGIVAPVLLQGFLTSSSTATLPSIQKAVENYGVDEEFNDFASALGIIFSQSSYILLFGIMLFYLLISNDIGISVVLLVKIIISVTLLALASPPVSGGLVAIMAILISMFGLPESCIGVVTPMVIILDFFCTSTRCGDIVNQTVISAASLGEMVQDSAKSE